MKNKSRIFTIGIASSNLFVLGLVFSVYFTNSNHKIELYSTSKVESEVQDHCQEEIQKVIERKRSMYICTLKKVRKDNGSSYTIKTRIIIKRNKDDHVVIETTGVLRDKTRHALEAQFCEDCKYTGDLKDPNAGLTEIMSEIVHLAETVEDKAKTSVSDARTEFNRKKTLTRLNRTKEKKCLGKWNENSEEFIEFDESEILECKMKKFSSMSMVDKESYYHDTLKKELWKQVLSDNDVDFLSSNLNRIVRQPYNYSLSTRSSANLIDNYIHWKDWFESQDTENTNAFILNMQSEAKVLTSFMNQEQKQIDLEFFNKGLVEDFQYAEIENHQTGRATSSPSDVDAIPFPALPVELPSSHEIENLY